MSSYIYYYKLEEVMRPYSNSSFQDLTHSGKQPNFKDVVDAFYSEVPNWCKSTSPDYTYINECFERIRHIFKRDCNYFWYSENDLDVTDDDELAKLHGEALNRVTDFIETMYDTKDKYIALIKAQQTLQGNILNDIENTSETWFNDTPQTSGSYVDATYTTNYTKNKNSISLGPVSAKLEEIDKAMNDIYDRWVAEFKKFIIVY